MTIEDFGARVVSVWQGLRPATRSLVERAYQTFGEQARERGENCRVEG